jgi:hypothetical protein
MTVTLQYKPEKFPVDPGQEYTFLFESIGAKAVQVYEMDVNGDLTFITKDDYNVSFSEPGPFFNGGTVTFTTAHLPATTHIYIERVTPITQRMNFLAYGRFPADDVEWALDKITMILQELDARKCSCAGEQEVLEH